MNNMIIQHRRPVMVVSDTDYWNHYHLSNIEQVIHNKHPSMPITPMGILRTQLIFKWIGWDLVKYKK